MAAVIGILNTNGVALAADSAVPFADLGEVKVGYSANRMLRLNANPPVSVMIAGYGYFLDVSWDLIIRRYRQLNKGLSLSTVEDYYHDFIKYVSNQRVLFLQQEEFLRDNIKEFLRYLIDTFNKLKDNNLLVSDTIERTIAHFKDQKREWLLNGVCQPFECYDLETFKSKVGLLCKEEMMKVFHETFVNQLTRNTAEYDLLMESLMAYITTRKEDKKTTMLIFTGYGERENYPTLLKANISGGFDNKVCAHVEPYEIVHIDPDKNPVAICPFGQKDIINALIAEVDPVFLENASIESDFIFKSIVAHVRSKLDLDEDELQSFDQTIQTINSDDITNKYLKPYQELRERNWKKWLEDIKTYGLNSMAQLADSLINVTAFQRLLSFNKDIGGKIDLATISREKGFVWLDRKSWYNGKDVDGKHGSLGI